MGFWENRNFCVHLCVVHLLTADDVPEGICHHQSHTITFKLRNSMTRINRLRTTMARDVITMTTYATRT